MLYRFLTINFINNAYTDPVTKFSKIVPVIKGEEIKSLGFTQIIVQNLRITQQWVK